MTSPPSPVDELEVDGLNRFAGLCVIGFGASMSYAIARPSTDSLFNQQFGKEGFPYAWLAVAVGILIVVAIYNRYAATVPLVHLYARISLISGGTLGLVMPLLPVFPRLATFLLYVWKDIYMVVLIEIIWSYANSVFSRTLARRTYGMFMALGTLGAVIGNLGTAWLANRAGFGTFSTLWLAAPLLVGMGVFVLLVPSLYVENIKGTQENYAKSFESLRLLFRSRYLTLMLILIAVTQVVINLIDYQYQGIIDTAFVTEDQKTEFNGLVYAAINFGSFVVQLMTGGILRLVGIGTTLLAVPLILGGALVAWTVTARVMTVAMVTKMAAVTKIASKAFDYSIFRASKEILYIPLSYREKTLGKAWIDIFMYREAKAATALLLIALGSTAGSSDEILGWLTFTLMGVWVVVTLLLIRRFKRLAAQESPPAPTVPDAV